MVNHDAEGNMTTIKKFIRWLGERNMTGALRRITQRPADEWEDGHYSACLVGIAGGYRVASSGHDWKAGSVQNNSLCVEMAFDKEYRAHEIIGPDEARGFVREIQALAQVERETVLAKRRDARQLKEIDAAIEKVTRDSQRVEIDEVTQKVAR